MSEAQVLVSSDDYYLSMGGGVSAAILAAGGDAIALDAAKRVPAALGDVVVTTAGTLSAQYIFHAVTIGPLTASFDPKEIVRQTTKRCLQLLAALNLSSIAFPAIGSGAARFSFEDVAAEMAETIFDEASRFDRPIDVTVYLFDRYGKMAPMDFVRFFEECAARVSRLVPAPAESADEARVDSPTVPAVLQEDTSWQEIRSRRLHGLTKLIGSLEDHRLKIESDLISGLAENDVDQMTAARERLKQNEVLRLGYLAELRALRSDSSEAAVQPTVPKTVFVSSTYSDLVEHRAAVKDEIARRDLLFRGMEHFGADPSNSAPSAKIVEEVRKADVYIGIFGFRYGSIDPNSGLSMTELEFEEAKVSDKPMFLYVMRDDALVKASDFERDPSSKRKLDDFRARILKERTVYPFKNVEELKRQVYEDLGKVLATAGLHATA
jgi:O-acetyl-ADP-ribose deacetylase (regulator of RNase III)